MRAYPVITYTDPETNEVCAVQIDDHGIHLETDESPAWRRNGTRSQRVTITGGGYRRAIANDHEHALAMLAYMFGKEIDRLKQHANDEYYRGLENGRRDALGKVRELLEPTTEGDEE